MSVKKCLKRVALSSTLIEHVSLAYVLHLQSYAFEKYSAALAESHFSREGVSLILIDEVISASRDEFSAVESGFDDFVAKCHKRKTVQ